MLVEALQELIRNYFEGSTARTHESLSAKADISSKTLQRIMKGEHNPNPQTVVALTKVIFNNDQCKVLNFLSEHMPDKIQKVKRFYQVSEIDLSRDSEVVRIMTNNPTSYLTGILLTMQKGVTKEMLQTRIGSNSLVLFQKFIDNNMLTEVSPGRYRFHEYRLGVYDGEILKGLARQGLEQYDPKDFGSDRALIHHASRFVSPSGRVLIREAALEFIEKAAIIAEENPGDEAVTLLTSLVRLISNEGEAQ